jgi:hypothetical protein
MTTWSLPSARPIACKDCPAFQRFHISARWAAESFHRLACNMNTTFRRKIYTRWCCIDRLSRHDFSGTMPASLGRAKSSTVANGLADQGRRRLSVNFVDCPGFHSHREHPASLANKTSLKIARIALILIATFGFKIMRKAFLFAKMCEREAQRGARDLDQSPERRIQLQNQEDRARNR